MASGLTYAVTIDDEGVRNGMDIQAGYGTDIHRGYIASNFL